MLSIEKHARYAEIMFCFKYLSKNALFYILMRLRARLVRSFNSIIPVPLLMGLSQLGFLLFLLACSVQSEGPLLEQVGDRSLKKQAWEGWARIDTCYYHDSIIVYQACPEKAVLPQKYLAGREYNAKLNVEAGGASRLGLVLAYSPTDMPEYFINLPGYTRSMDPSVRKDIPRQILEFDTSKARVSSTDIRELYIIRLEQQPEFLSGGMKLRLDRYPTIKALRLSSTGMVVMSTFDLYFIFSLLLKKTEK